MRPEERAQLIRRMYDESNQGNMDVMDAVYAQNCSFHDPMFAATGLADMKEQGRQMQSAIPDMHANVHEVLVDGDMSATRWTMGGTQRGEIKSKTLNLPATGKSFTFSGVTIDKWEGGRIVEEWSYYDTADIMQQIGLMPDQAQMAEMSSQRSAR